MIQKESEQGKNDVRYKLQTNLNVLISYLFSMNNLSTILGILYLLILPISFNQCKPQQLPFN